MDCGRFLVAPEDVDDTDGARPTKHVGHGVFGIGDLPFPGLVAKLEGHLYNLSDPGAANRMPLGLEPAAGVRRQFLTSALLAFMAFYCCKFG